MNGVGGPTLERLRHLVERALAKHGVRLSGVSLEGLALDAIRRAFEIERLDEDHHAQRAKGVRRGDDVRGRLRLSLISTHRRAVPHELGGGGGRATQRAGFKRARQLRESSRRALGVLVVVHQEHALEHQLQLLEGLTRPLAGEEGWKVARARGGLAARVRAETGDEVFLEPVAKEALEAGAHGGAQMVLLRVDGANEQLVDALQQAETLAEVEGGQALHQIVVALGRHRELVLVDAATEHRVGLHLVQRELGGRRDRHLTDRLGELQRRAAVAHGAALHRRLGRRRGRGVAAETPAQEIAALAEELLECILRETLRGSILQRIEEVPRRRQHRSRRRHDGSRASASARPIAADLAGEHLCCWKSSAGAGFKPFRHDEGCGDGFLTRKQQHDRHAQKPRLFAHARFPLAGRSPSRGFFLKV